MQEAVRDKIRNLKLQYKDYPQKELLVALTNPCPDRDYELEVSFPEFTCLCPLNPGQPDFATINLKYVPDQYILEFKSLKFYLTSYRTVEIFHETATNRILDDLTDTLKPRKLDILADWNVRGGVKVKISVSYLKK